MRVSSFFFLPSSHALLCAQTGDKEQEEVGGCSISPCDVQPAAESATVTSDTGFN